MKMRQPTLNIADGVLLGVAVLCGSTMSIELLWPHTLDAPAGKVSDAGSESAEPGVRDDDETPSSRSYDSITARPLFTLDRRPYQPPIDEPPQEAKPEPPPPRIEFALSAVVTTGERRIALLKPKKASETVKLSVGETHEGWTLTDVLADGVVLTNGAQTMEVMLQPERGQGMETAAVKGDR